MLKLGTRRIVASRTWSLGVALEFPGTQKAPEGIKIIVNFVDEVDDARIIKNINGNDMIGTLSGGWVSGRVGVGEWGARQLFGRWISPRGFAPLSGDTCEPQGPRAPTIRALRGFCLL